MAHTFVDLPQNHGKVFLYEYDPLNGSLSKFRQVLWGDYLTIDPNPSQQNPGIDYVPIIWGPNLPNPKKLYIRKEHTVDERPLEIIFVDVGQGDGAVLITPERDHEERIMIIDAGEGSHMKNFIYGRFRAYGGFNFESAIITHPDTDHYKGFEEIFGNNNIGFRTVYHNGLCERPTGSEFDKLKGKVEVVGEEKSFVGSLCETKQDLIPEFSDDSTFGNYEYAPMIHNALTNPKIDEIKMLSTDPAHCVHENGRAYMPGFSPSDGKPYSLEVLGPVVRKKDANGKPLLEVFNSNYGVFKNGHSILLRLHFGKFRVFFGGDLNYQAEKYLLCHYAGLDKFPKPNKPEHATMMNECRHWFESEIMKVCHHGAEKVTDEFMQVVNPACFVISSGDEEGHVHPRPDLLGRLGKNGRGKTPVLLSTELQRSTREQEDDKLISDLFNEIDGLNSVNVATVKKAIKEKVKELTRTNVDVYGAIYLKTNGDRLITAFKYEEESDLKKWFYFEYRIGAEGELKLIS